MTNPQLENLRMIRYTPRTIHQFMGETSHDTIAQMSAIKEQEKFRADPRFPFYQATERFKRLKKIVTGQPYQPMFS